MLKRLQAHLRSWVPWVRFQELNREGWRQAAARCHIQRQILRTPPVITATAGAKEVRILTWRRDWLNALWALKTFYHFSGVDYPLHIHDGGLLPWQAAALRRHFPTARLVTRQEADAVAGRMLAERGLRRCADYRATNIATAKLFDFFLLSKAEGVVSIDSDIVFFERPTALLAAGAGRNLYNRDLAYAYSLSLDDLERAFGIRPVPLINSGLSWVWRESLDFARIDRWLAEPRLYADKWVTEQTLHALASTLWGVDLLPDAYLVGTTPGLPDGVICKHYPGFFRPLLYSEGMRRLIDGTSFFGSGDDQRDTDARPATAEWQGRSA